MYLSNFIVSIFVKIPTSPNWQTLWNVLIFLTALFIIGFILTTVKRFSSLGLGQILVLIPIIGHVIKFAKKNSVVFVCEGGLATNTDRSTFSPIITYKGKTFVPALITGKLCCKSGEKFKIWGLFFHSPFKMSVVDSDTKILAALSWDGFLKYWPTGGTADVPEMKNLEECSIAEYWEKIHPEEIRPEEPEEDE